MTSALRRVAGGLASLGGAWVIYMSLSGPSVEALACPLGGCPGVQFGGLFGEAVLALGVLLLLDGLIGIWGARFAYTAGAALSALLLLATAYVTWADLGVNYLSTFVSHAEVGMALAAVALVGNALGARGKGGISEQANPMNLPVFG